MKNQFITFRHKNGTILATIEEKCVTLANLQGEIYKQFPRQHFRPEDFPEQTTFPSDYRQARAAFSRREAIKKAEAKAVAEAKWAAAREERRKEILFVRRVRNMAFQSDEVIAYYTTVYGMEMSRDCGWCESYNILSDEEEKVFLQKDEAQKYYDELKEKYTPSSSNEHPVNLILREISIDSTNILAVTDYKTMLSVLADGDLLNDLEYEILFPEYKSIDGAIYVEWAWTPYIGYARRFNGLHVGMYGETEEDLITGNEEYTERTNRTLLLTAEDIADLTAEELTEALEEELYNDNYWRWRCGTATIDNAITEIVEELTSDSWNLNIKQ